MKNLCKHFSGWGNFQHPVTSFTKGTILSLLLIACTTAFTACNSDESSLPTAGNQLQLSFGIHAPESRAIFTDTKLPDNSPVGVRLDGYADYANLVYTGSTTSGTQSWSSTTSVTLTDTKGTLYAYWPQNNAAAIDAIDVDMTAADQTDWLYATPVTDVNEDKASVAVTMNHALANINVTVNKGTYKGDGNITNITLQSDGIALGGTFNAAQTTPGYTAFEDEGKPLSRTVTTTAGAAATDIMVVPTGTSAAVTFLLTIDGIQFTATSAAVQLAMGNSYQYMLNLSDISTYMEISGFSVKVWTSTTGGTLDLEEYDPWETIANGVYAVSADGKPVDIANADVTAIGVALVAGEHKFMIEKNETNNTDTYKAAYNEFGASNTEYTHLYWGVGLGTDYTGIPTYNTADASNSEGYLPRASGNYAATPKLSGEYYRWNTGALSDFNGKPNSDVIKTIITNGTNDYKMYAPIGILLNKFNDANNKENGGYIDWYVPALGQLALMFLNNSKINEALTKIGGQNISSNPYWSSSEGNSNDSWRINFNNGKVDYISKLAAGRVRFVRDLQ